MNRSKLERLQASLCENKLDAFFCRMSVNILALTGYWPCNHAVAAVIPQAGNPVLVVPETELQNAQKEAEGLELCAYALESTELLRGAMDGMEHTLRSVLKKMGLLHARIGIEQSFEDGASGRLFGDFKYPSLPTWQLLQRFFPNACFVDAADAILSLRMVKEPEEAKAIQKAVEAACIGYKAVRRALRPGMTEADVSALLEGTILSQGTGRSGARYARGFSSVYAGDRGAEQWTHWACTTGRVIRRNDVVMMELGVVCDGYWADLTRCMCAGEPPEKAKRVLAVLLEAQRRGIEAAVPGTPIGEIDRVCHAYCTAKGYGKEYYRHNCGHASGYNYHEVPSVHQANTTPVREGMILCVEPGIYIPGEFGLRTEDMVYITKDGAKLLSNYPHEL